MSYTSTTEFDYLQTNRSVKNVNPLSRIYAATEHIGVPTRRILYSENLLRVNDKPRVVSFNASKIELNIMTLINKLKELELSDVCESGEGNLIQFNLNKAVVNKLLIRLSKIPQIVPEEDCSFTLHFTSKKNKSILLSVLNGDELKILEKGKATQYPSSIFETVRIINRLI